MNKVLSFITICGLVGLGKYIFQYSQVPDGKILQWLATAGIISSFATLLSLIYLFARKLAVIQMTKKRSSFIEMLKQREKSIGRNSMFPLIALPSVREGLPEIEIIENNFSQKQNCSTIDIK